MGRFSAKEEPMPDAVAARLRKQIRSLRRSSGRPRYPDEIKAAAVAYARQCRLEGRSQRTAAEDLDLPLPTLSLWLRQERRDEGFRSVRPRPESEQPVCASSLILVTPSGCRVEGLTVGEAAALLRVLG